MNMESRTNNFAHGTFKVDTQYMGRSFNTYRVETPRPAKEYDERTLADAAGYGPRHFGYSVKYIEDNPNVAHVNLHTD